MQLILIFTLAIATLLSIVVHAECELSSDASCYEARKGRDGGNGHSHYNVPSFPCPIEFAQLYNPDETLIVSDGLIVFIGSGLFSSGMNHTIDPINDGPFVRVAKAGQYRVTFTAHTLDISPVVVVSLYVNGQPVPGPEYSLAVGVNTFSFMNVLVDLAAGDTIAIHIGGDIILLAQDSMPTMNLLVISLSLD